MSATALTHSHANDHAQQERAARRAEEAEATAEHGSAPGDWCEDDEDFDSSLPGFDDHDAYDDCYDYWEACVGKPSARSGCESRVLLRAIERRERQSERQHVCVHICVHICAHAL